jgi:hypothetical protein
MRLTRSVCGGSLRIMAKETHSGRYGGLRNRFEVRLEGIRSEIRLIQLP